MSTIKASTAQRSITLLQKCKKLGFVLCLYTAESREDWLKWKVDYCKHFGIEPSYVNASPLLGGKNHKTIL